MLSSSAKAKRIRTSHINQFKTLSSEKTNPKTKEIATALRVKTGKTSPVIVTLKAESISSSLSEEELTKISNFRESARSSRARTLKFLRAAGIVAKDSEELAEPYKVF